MAAELVVLLALLQQSAKPMTSAALAEATCMDADIAEDILASQVHFGAVTHDAVAGTYTAVKKGGAL